jgi:hypothetical protein
MNRTQQSSNTCSDASTFLQKVSNTPNLRSLARRRQHFDRQMQSRSRSLSRVSLTNSEDRMSENSQILYMEPTKCEGRRRRSPQVSVDSMHATSIEDSSDTEGVEDETAETLAWGVINQEISEWKYVCNSGRPYCWSREAKSKRSRRKQPFSRNLRQFLRSGDGSEEGSYEQNSAESENLSGDAENLDTMAYTVAIQLLSSCFTLPDCLIGLPPKYMSAEVHGDSVMPDPRMISSLRLHSQFRYSPSFGHESRNTSPVQFWPGAYDGSPAPPTEEPEIIHTQISTDEPVSRKGRGCRALTNSEVSELSFHIQKDNYESRRNTIDRDISAVTKAWYRRNGFVKLSLDH